MSFADLFKTEWVEKTLSRYKYNTLEDCYAAIGFGAISPQKIITRLLEEYKKENKEEVYYTNSTSGVEDVYSALLDLNDVKNTLETCTEQYVSIHFGDGAAIVLARGNIKNVIPECNLN